MISSAEPCEGCICSCPLDAPVDIWMMPAKSQTLGAIIDNAKAYFEYLAKGSTQLLMYRAAMAETAPLR